MTQLTEDITKHVERTLADETGLAGWKFVQDTLTATNPQAAYRIVVAKDSKIRPLIYSKEQL